MTLLDAQGNPLQPSRGDERLDQITELVRMFDESGEWGKLEAQFQATLKTARLHAGSLVTISLGEQVPNVASANGAALTRLMAQIAVNAMVLQEREDQANAVEGKVIQMHKEEGDAAGT